jgi:hypothetical protein
MWQRLVSAFKTEEITPTETGFKPIVGSIKYQSLSQSTVLVSSTVTLNFYASTFIPNYSRCVGVDMEKACFIQVLFEIVVCGFDNSPTT